MGYEGSLSTLHRQIRELRKEEKRKNQITTRVETEPGVQMQYDWKEWTLPVDGKPLKIYLHELVLSYSRKKYYTYSLCITTADVIRAIEGGIHFFGGIAPELVIDNPKQMVITHERDGIDCQNYRPRTKGKAERPFAQFEGDRETDDRSCHSSGDVEKCQHKAGTLCLQSAGGIP